jgi:hypothetical protein
MEVHCMSLKDDDIVTTRVQPRRRFLARVSGAVAGALAIVAGSAPAIARDAKDFIPADNKSVDIDKRDPRADRDKRSGDQA